MRVSAWVSAGIAVIRDYLACFISHIRYRASVLCIVLGSWRDSIVVLIVRLMHVPQLPGEGDAKGLRLPFQNGQSRASSGGCRRASDDAASLLEI